MPAELLTDVVAYQGDVLRNIVGIRRSQDLFDDLTDDPDDYALAQEAESRTRPALTGAGVINRPFDYGVIAHPFTMHNWAQTRFSDGSFGVFYSSLDLETTIRETVYHTLLDLDAANFLNHRQPIIRERRVWLVAVDAILYDCVDRADEYPALIHPHDYRFTNTVGRYIHENDRDGLLTRSARCDGVNAPVFRSDRLTNPRDHCFLSYTVNVQDEIVSVRRSPGRVEHEIPWADYDLAFRDH